MNALNDIRNLTHPRSHLRGHFRGHSRQRGSTLLLVVAVLLMILLISMAYLQVARADRLNGAAMRIVDATDAVTKASINAVAFRLLEDRIDNNGNLLPDENYDYPGLKDMHLATTFPTIDPSNGTLNWDQVSLIGLKYADNTTAQSGLDAQDDDVLYDSTTGRPKNDIDSSNGKWSDSDGDTIVDSFAEEAPIPQLAGLKWYTSYRVVDLGSLLNVNIATAMTTASASDIDYGGQSPRGYTPANLDLTRLFRRWDFNTVSGGAATTWATEVGTHYTPSGEAKRAGLLPFRFGLPDGTNATMPTAASITNVDDPTAFAPRSIGEIWWGTTPPTNPPKTPGARRYGSSLLKLGIENEIELRNRNGLNNASVDTLIESQLDSVLQEETHHGTFADVTTNNDTSIQGVAEYLLGVDPNNSNAPYPVDDRRFRSLRQQLTTASGADDFLPDFVDTKFDEITGTGAHHRYDLVHQHPYTTDAEAVTRADEIGQRIMEVFEMGLTPAEKYFDTYGANPNERAELAYQLAASVQDYSDADSHPTLIEVKDAAGNSLAPVKRYVSGLERLPFLREVYIQMAYEDMDLLPMGAPDGLFDTWVARDPTNVGTTVDGGQGIAIEMGNPFTQQIDLAQTPVQIVILEDDVPAFTIDVAALTEAIDARDDTGDSTNDVLIIVADPLPASAVAETDAGGMARGSNLALDLGFDSAAHIEPVANIPFTAGVDISIELQVQVVEGTGTTRWVTYDQMKVGGFQVPVSQTHMPAMTRADAHAQFSMARPGENIHYIAPFGMSSAFAEQISDREPVDVPKEYHTADAEYLGKDTKATLVGDTRLDFLRLGVPNRAYFTSTELGWTAILGLMEEENAGGGKGKGKGKGKGMGGGNKVTTITEVIQERLALNGGSLGMDQAFFLDMTHPQPRAVANGPGLPSHAAMVIDRFTTISPLFDGVDNDGDDPTSPDEADISKTPETFIPGRLNINTVPLHIATLAAPVPDSLQNNEDWFRAIIAYRDDVTTNNGNTAVDESKVRETTDTTVRDPLHRADKGIESLAELMHFEIPVAQATFDTQYYAWNGTDETTATATPVNLFPMPEDANYAETVTATGPLEEERLARMQFIQNTFTVRSDVYAAYILVRGYDPDDLTNPVVQRRVTVIFDRSNVFNPTDPVRILGMYQE